MGAFKSFEAKDIITTPFVVNKGFSFYGDSEFTGSGLDKFIGTNLSGLFSTKLGPNDVPDYSLNIFKSESFKTVQSNISFTNPTLSPNDIVTDFTILEDVSHILTNSTGLINILQNPNIELYATFSGNFTFIGASNINNYIIYNLIINPSSTTPLQSNVFTTQSNGFTGNISSSYLIDFPLFPFNSGPTEPDVNNLYIYNSVFAFDFAGNLLPNESILFPQLNTSFIISSQSLSPSSSNPLTGINDTQYQRLVYNSIKQLYYSNYIGNPFPDSIDYTGSGNYAQFDNFLQSHPLDIRYFPTASNTQIGVINIPSKVYGEYVKPGSFLYQSSSVYVYDDGEGNLLNNIDSTKCGNIIYSHGLAIITTSSFTNLSSFISSPNITCSFSSSLTLFETQYKCNIKENEFNFSQNPSIISGSNGSLYGYATSSYFDPYITTVGLYNENQDLIAVAKLSQPLPSSRTTDTNIIINLDQ
jgi:hypothetical protein